MVTIDEAKKMEQRIEIMPDSIKDKIIYDMEELNYFKMLFSSHPVTTSFLKIIQDETGITQITWLILQNSIPIPVDII